MQLEAWRLWKDIIRKTTRLFNTHQKPEIKPHIACPVYKLANKTD